MPARFVGGFLLLLGLAGSVFAVLVLQEMLPVDGRPGGPLLLGLLAPLCVLCITAGARLLVFGAEAKSKGLIPPIVWMSLGIALLANAAAASILSTVPVNALAVISALCAIWMILAWNRARKRGI